MTRFGGLVIDVSPLRTSRPFRYAFSARLISLLGIGLLVVAVPAQTYQLTGSTLQVAGVSTAMAIAMFFGSLFGGVLADRYDRRRTIPQCCGSRLCHSRVQCALAGPVDVGHLRRGRCRRHGRRRQ
ncbi:MFS transporter [Rhodococcus erythropolis]|uniref:MFS transporter n=1 Tax=Rhodococcus erythropolis TaxID=1833 RepID=UPI0022A99912|nr:MULTISPECIES: MFS transporter [Rhodococcus erythropolis group]MCZ4527448.1 MFS transporter [Rhodococcus erythropolis]